MCSYMCTLTQYLSEPNCLLNPESSDFSVCLSVLLSLSLCSAARQNLVSSSGFLSGLNSGLFKSGPFPWEQSPEPRR